VCEFRNDLARLAREQEQYPSTQETRAFACEQADESPKSGAALVGEYDLREDVPRRWVERERVGEAAERFGFGSAERIVFRLCERGSREGIPILLVVVRIEYVVSCGTLCILRRGGFRIRYLSDTLEST
jgi:hypothetical protein